jgi:hypothetical protein
MSDAVACLALAVLPVTALFWTAAPLVSSFESSKDLLQRPLFTCNQEQMFEEMLQCVNCSPTPPCSGDAIGPRCLDTSLDDGVAELVDNSG